MVVLIGTEFHFPESFAVDTIDGLSFTAIPVTGKAPPYSPHRNDAHIGDNIGIKIVEVSTGKISFLRPRFGGNYR